MRKEKFVPKEYYHIYSRTILNSAEFKNYRNAKKLEQTFLISNSTNSGGAFQFIRNHKNAPTEDILKILKNGEKLIDILCYTIMPDHYHLLVREVKNNGIKNFIHKCNTSIAKYINIKNERRGPLFESRFKSKHINTNKYLLHLSLYIHLNPLDFLVGKDWRRHGLKNWSSIKPKLLDYQWSSIKYFLDTAPKNPIISGTEIIREQFDNKKEYENFLRDWSEEQTSEEQTEDKSIFID
jgi:putative transposase